MTRSVLFLLALSVASQVEADIPATPVMTLHQFNGGAEIPNHDVDGFARKGAGSPAGTLFQRTSLTQTLAARIDRGMSIERALATGLCPLEEAGRRGARAGRWRSD